MSHRLGGGYDPRYARGALTWPEDATYVEAGASLLRAGALDAPPWPAGTEVSLHLSRAPFCEAPEVQRFFVERLASRLPAGIGSIGLHLCGRLGDGLGAFGFGSAFEPEPLHEQRALDFISRLADAVDCSVVVENANYYDRDLRASLRVIDFLNRLTELTRARLIVDVAHLVMCAHNLGVPELLLAGRIASKRVNVLHLSGIHVAPSGALHDGHQHPVHERVWTLARQLLALVETPCTIVLEHTDLRWSDADPAFSADLAEARSLLAPPDFVPAHQIEPEAAGVGYLINIVLPQRFPKLAAHLGPSEFSRIVRAWCPGYLERVRARAPLSLPVRGDEHVLYAHDSVDPVDDFASFLLAEARS